MRRITMKSSVVFFARVFIPNRFRLNPSESATKWTPADYLLRQPREFPIYSEFRCGLTGRSIFAIYLDVGSHLAAHLVKRSARTPISSLLRRKIDFRSFVSAIRNLHGGGQQIHAGADEILLDGWKQQKIPEQARANTENQIFCATTQTSFRPETKMPDRNLEGNDKTDDSHRCNAQKRFL